MRSASSLRLASPFRRRGFALFLALALVVVQMLGLAHRIVHADRAQLAAASAFNAGAEAAALKASVHRGGSGWLQSLFAGHDQSHDCDAFDQMSHADFAVGATLDAAVSTAPAEACLMHAAWHLAAQAQGFLARAPPLAA